jgi:HEPN domain-containing protein
MSLAVEKAVKGLYQQRTGKIPPKTHNLIYLLTQLEIKPEREIAKYIAILNEANIAARYPESLEVLHKNYTETVTSNVLKQSEEVLLWIKEQF